MTIKEEICNLEQKCYEVGSWPVGLGRAQSAYVPTSIYAKSHTIWDLANIYLIQMILIPQLSRILVYAQNGHNDGHEDA